MPRLVLYEVQARCQRQGMKKAVTRAEAYPESRRHYTDHAAAFTPRRRQQATRALQRLNANMDGVFKLIEQRGGARTAS